MDKTAGGLRPGSKNRPSQDGFFPHTAKLRFGVFEVNLRERELRKFGLRIKLQQKPFQVLERLLQTPGEFVGREELARILWPDLHVMFDRSLNTAVNALRRALGDHGKNPHFIETRPGLGYVFIGSVEPVAEPPVPVQRPAQPNPTQRGNIPAYQECLRGRFFANKMTETDIRKSVAYFESALAHDAGCALAHAGLADTWLLFALFGLLPPPECFARARKAAEAALRIDDLLPEAHVAQGQVKQFCDWDWAGAESCYLRALKLNASDAAAHRHYAHLLSAMGRFEEALKRIGIAQELDPLSLVINVGFAWIHFMSRDFSGAAEQSWKTLAMEPRFAPAQNTLGLAYEQLGMIDEATVELNNARMCSENHPAAVAALAHVHARAGNARAAEESLADLKRASEKRYVSPYWVSIVYAGLGERELAFESLDRACEERDVWLAWLKVDPRFDGLREDARFERLLGRIGLPRSSVAAL